MIIENERTPNEIAYRNLKPEIDKTYDKGRFIAIHNQKIVADGATLPELLTTLGTQGLNPKECLAVQAGVDYREFAYILLPGAKNPRIDARLGTEATLMRTQ
jgi:hypothetical protein